MSTHQMKLQPAPFAAIKEGRKTVEMRLYDEKRKLIGIGDRIVFSQAETAEALYVVVTALRRYPSFDELYTHENHASLGYAEEETACPSDMSQYYHPTEIERYGVLAVEIRRISQ